MWLDAVACFVIPGLARWGVSVVDRFDGTRYPVHSVRLRWRVSLDEWITMATAEWQRDDITVHFEPRELD
jgi:hypothetical protein